MTPQRSRILLHLESILAVLSAVATVLVLWRPNWIEVGFGIDPDQGSGAAELIIAAGLGAAALLLSAAAWRERQRLRALRAR